MNTKILELKGITKQFPGVLALNEVSIDLHEGEVLGLMGENGAGKSTLIKILAGDYRKDAGQIVVNGETVDFHCPADSQNMGIRVIYQELNTLDTLSVAENIFVGALPRTKKLKILDWKKLFADAAAVLAQMEVDINPKEIVGNLSVHEKQMVEIARAISQEAAILVMDEPTAALGEKDTVSLFNVVRKLKSRGVAVIYISHRLEEVFQITDRITVLRDGEKIDTVATGETDKKGLISMMVGREPDEFYSKRELTVGPTLLEVKNLTIEDIVEDVSFEVKSGEIVGLFGLMGSGRVNVVHALFGIDKIDSGVIEIDGEPVTISGPSQALKLGIGLMPLDKKLEGLALDLSVSSNIIMANVDNNSRWGLLDRKRETARAQKWVDDVNIKTPTLQTPASSLSGGNQQKIVLAKLLETGSRVFLMNEPTRGIDVGAKSDIYRMMECLCEAGAGIVMLSSDMLEMLSMADRIYVISEGRITGEFSRAQADQNKLLHAATA
jgi:ribose transport system ATP-binding protein